MDNMVPEELLIKYVDSFNNNPTVNDVARLIIDTDEYPWVVCMTDMDGNILFSIPQHRVIEIVDDITRDVELKLNKDSHV